MIILKNRGLIGINGNDTIPFLNNILTRNIDNLNQDNLTYAALLSPQGKYLFDLFIIKNGETSFLIDSNDSKELFAKLRMYKLRSEIELIDLNNELGVFYSPFEIDDKNYICKKDIRNENMGFRLYGSLNTNNLGNFADYEYLRIKNEIPEPSFDLIRDKDFALEGLLDEMGAIDFHKGCYIGQEMTSRMKRRGTLKQKLCKFEFIGAPPEFDTPIIANNQEIGRTRSISKNLGLALIRFDRLKLAQDNDLKLFALDTEIFIKQIDWQ